MIEFCLQFAKKKSTLTESKKYNNFSILKTAIDYVIRDQKIFSEALLQAYFKKPKFFETKSQCLLFVYPRMKLQ